MCSYVFLINILSDNRVIMCGIQDSSYTVNFSNLVTSCTNAHKHCTSTTCIANYIYDAHQDGLYKLCSNGMNVLVTPNAWWSWGLGVEKYLPDRYIGAQNWCIVYCRP